MPPGKETGKVHRVALIAQSAEHLHGKEKVKGSIPFQGSDWMWRPGLIRDRAASSVMPG